MAVVDDRGRIFGRFNIVDLALAVLLFGLIPLAYGGYALFRTPPPTLTSVEPRSLQLDSEMRLRIHGTNIRPYMRVSIDNNQTRQFLFKDATTAEVVFADVPPGQYDVILYDFAQERSRLPKALTITEPALPPTEVYAAGYLTGVTPDLLPTLKPGFSFQGAATILKIGRTSSDIARVAAADRVLEVPVNKTLKMEMLVKVPCSVQATPNGIANCRAGSPNGPGVFLGPPLGPGVYLMFPMFDVRLPFLISQVRPPVEPTLIDVTVKTPPGEDAGELARVGDTDVGLAENQFSAGGVVTRALHGNRELTLRLPAFPTSAGWDYAGQSLRVGAPFSFINTRYQLSGTISMVPPLPTAASAPK